MQPERPLTAVVLALLIAHTVDSTANRHTAAAPAHLAVPIPALRIDPNTASSAELELLPGIGPAIAQNIVSYREHSPAHPPFTCPADLDAVKRIGPAIVAQISPYLVFEPPNTDAPPHSSPLLIARTGGSNAREPHAVDAESDESQPFAAEAVESHAAEAGRP